MLLTKYRLYPDFISFSTTVLLSASAFNTEYDMAFSYVSLVSSDQCFQYLLVHHDLDIFEEYWLDKFL